MWLTDFIPSAGEPLQVTCKLLGTANRNTGTNLTTVPTPSCAADGDWQVLLWQYFTNATPNWDTVDWGPDPGQWKQPSFTPGSGFRANMAIRKITTANVGTPFAVQQTSGALGIRYATFIIKGKVRDIDPVPAVTASGTNDMAAAGTNNQWVDHPPFLPLTSPEDMILAFKAQTAINGENDLQVPAEDGVRVLASACSVETVSSAGTPANLGYVAQLWNGTNYVDLNGDGESLAGWTLVRMERDTASQGINTEYALREQVLGTGTAYEIWKDFTLTAGVTYVIAVDMCNVLSTGSGTQTSSPWFLVVPPSGTANQIGAAGNGIVNSFMGVGGMTVNNYLRRHYWNNSFGGYSYVSALRFTATETGTHRFRVGVIRQDEVATFPGSLLTHSGSTSRGFRGNFISLCALETGIASQFVAAPNQGLMERPEPTVLSATNRRRLLCVYDPNASNGGNRQQFAIFRNGTAKRPLNRIVHQQHLHRLTQSVNNGRDVAATTGGSFNFDSGTTIHRHSNEIVGMWLGTKFYYEATIVTASTGFYLGYAYAGHNPDLTGTAYPSTGGTHGYLVSATSGSVVSSNNGSLTGLASWVAGDVIGLLVDFSNSASVLVTVTRNGVVYGTRTLPSGKIWWSVGVRAHITDVVNNVTGYAGRYTVNLTGPFMYPPPGALPFDFDNMGAPLGSQLFTSDGTFTKPAGASTFIVYAVGGGGGGGSGSVGSRSSTYCGGGEGGGGGGYSIKVLAANVVGATENVIVGQGGAGGPVAGPTIGSVAGAVGANGTASSFGAHVTAGGGTGGQAGWEGNTPAFAQAAGGTGTTSSGGGGWRLIPNGGAATCFTTENGSASLGPGGGGAGGGGTYVGGAADYDGSRGGNAPTDAVPAGGAGGVSAMASTADGVVPSNASPTYPDVNGSGAGGGGGGCWYPFTAGVDATGPSGDGADGGLYGSGGGGGGAGISYGSGFPGTGGKGGDGADGCVYVVWY